MKKLFLFTLVGLLSFSCAKKSSDTEDDSDNDRTEKKRDFETKLFSYADSAVWNNSDNSFDFSCSIDYPVAGPKALVDSTRQWIVQYLDMNDSVAGEIKAPKPSEFDAFIKGESDIFKESWEETLKELEAEENEDEYGIWYSQSFSISIKKVFEDSMFISFHNEGYIYLGGAHGMPWDTGVTFLMNGERPGWDLFVLDVAEEQALRRIVTKYLLQQYFGGEEDILMDLADWNDCAPNELPLPSTPPYITNEGICFTYGAYEIGAYAYGLPTCTVPLDEVKDMLNSKYFE